MITHRAFLLAVVLVVIYALVLVAIAYAAVVNWR